MVRIHGPYPDRGNTWRIKIVDRATKKTESRVYGSEKEANDAAIELRKKAAKEVGISVAGALDLYELYLREKGNKARTIETTMYRIRSVFGRVEKIALVALTSKTAEEIFTATVTAKTRFDRVLSVDSKRNTLNESRTFLRWCVAKKYLKVNPLEDVETVGKRRKGKPQLTKNEAKLWLATALTLIASGDLGALAAATALLMGMRASEVAERVVRNLDDDFQTLWITDAKTQAGIRRLQVPELLQSAYRKAATGKAPTERIFGDVNRHWVLRAVQRLSKAAGVPRVTPHGLRGTHASLAVAAGATGAIVAGALGHESFATTQAHYATPESVSDAKQNALTESLQN